MASAELAALSFELSRERLDKQERVLDELRSRTGVLLAASSLAASFLGSEAFGESGWGLLGVVAIAAFLVTMAASVFVLLPRDRLIFALVGSAVYEQFYSLEGGQEEVHLGLRPRSVLGRERQAVPSAEARVRGRGDRSRGGGACLGRSRRGYNLMSDG
jgi:hypothetical protein